MAAALSHDASGRIKGEPPIVETMRGVKYDPGNGKAPASVTDMVDQSLSKDGGLTNLKATYGIFGTTGAAQFCGIYDAVRTTALYLFQTRGVAPDVADRHPGRAQLSRRAEVLMNRNCNKLF